MINFFLIMYHYQYLIAVFFLYYTHKLSATFNFAGKDSLSPEESILLLDDYDSDQENDYTSKEEEREDEDDGCLKVGSIVMFSYMWQWAFWW